MGAEASVSDLEGTPRHAGTGSSGRRSGSMLRQISLQQVQLTGAAAGGQEAAGRPWPMAWLKRKELRLWAPISGLLNKCQPAPTSVRSQGHSNCAASPSSLQVSPDSLQDV